MFSYQRLAGHYEKSANQMRDEQITLPGIFNCEQNFKSTIE
jgi:hypothetical protein